MDMRCVARCWRAVRSEAAGDVGHRQGFATRQRTNTVQPGGTALFGARGRRAALPMSRIAALLSPKRSLGCRRQAKLRFAERRAPTLAPTITVAAHVHMRNPG